MCLVHTTGEAMVANMSRFIAAMDHSGGSTGGVLERYQQEYTEDNKMDLVHEMRLRMVNSEHFTNDNIWAAILYKDTVERGMVDILAEKNISTFLKIDSGCTEDGLLKQFPISQMIDFAIANGCKGTKMRSIVTSGAVLEPILTQQFAIAKTISDARLLPIIEPEIEIDDPDKRVHESMLADRLYSKLNSIDYSVVLKLTLPEESNLYINLAEHPRVIKLVGLSGGYSTDEACKRLSENDIMSASFSRALSEGLYANLNDNEFSEVLGWNIKKIVDASST